MTEFYFPSEFAEAYALVWIKDHLATSVPDHPNLSLIAILKQHEKDIVKCQKKGVPLWPLLSQDFRTKVLELAYPWATTLLALQIPDLVRNISEVLQEHKLNLTPEWIAMNLAAFRDELRAYL